MQFIFFKAAPPYSKTNGFWEKRYWTDGITGPLTHSEAQRLSAMLGGKWFEVTSPVQTLEEFFKRLDMEMPTEFKTQRPAELTIEQEFGRAGKKEADKFELVKSVVLKSSQAENKKRIEEVLQEEVPAYAEQVKTLADARERKEFDYIEVIGKKRDVASILKAYTIYKFKDIDITRI